MLRNGLMQKVRQYASVHNLIRKSQVAKDLDFPATQVNYAVRSLIKQGYLVRVARGTYEFQEKRFYPSCGIEDKIWRAMKISPTFSASDIAKQTGGSRSNIYKHFRKYKAEEYIKRSGMQKTLSGNYEKVYRLTIKGQQQAKHPLLTIFKPDPIIQDTVTLNKIICSGMAASSETALKTAISLSRSIHKRLKEDAEA